MSTHKRNCKHCGAPAETATTTDNRTIQSDACYGCRNRYNAAYRLTTDAIHTMSRAQHLLEMYPEDDPEGAELADECGKVTSLLDGLQRMIDARRNA